MRYFTTFLLVIAFFFCSTARASEFRVPVYFEVVYEPPAPFLNEVNLFTNWKVTREKCEQRFSVITQYLNETFLIENPDYKFWNFVTDKKDCEWIIRITVTLTTQRIRLNAHVLSKDGSKVESIELCEISRNSIESLPEYNSSSLDKLTECLWREIQSTLLKADQDRVIELKLKELVPLAKAAQWSHSEETSDEDNITKRGIVMPGLWHEALKPLRGARFKLQCAGVPNMLELQGEMTRATYTTQGRQVIDALLMRPAEHNENKRILKKLLKNKHCIDNAQVYFYTDFNSEVANRSGSK